MHELKQKARALRRALAEKKLMDVQPEQDADGESSTDDVELARTFAEDAETILSKRPIVAVGTDISSGCVIVYTSRPYTKTDQKVISEGLDENLPIVFRSLDTGVQGPGNTALDALPEPVLRNERVTCGSSISLANYRGAGTLGALVRDSSGNLFGLSCSHVISGCGYVREGMQILSPGVLDIVPDWPDPRVIGYFSRALPLVAGDPTVIGEADNVDAALFRVTSEDVVSSYQGDAYDTPINIHELDEEDEGTLEIEKVGRSSGHTEGSIRSGIDGPMEIAFSVISYPEHGQQRKFEATVFTDGLWVADSLGAGFARPGDSGALVVTRSVGGAQRKAVGLVIAGTKEYNALVLPIKAVLDALDVELVSNHGV